MSIWKALGSAAGAFAVIAAVIIVILIGLIVIGGLVLVLSTIFEAILEAMSS